MVLLYYINIIRPAAQLLQFVPPAENMTLILLIALLRSRETNNAICWRNGFITRVYIICSLLKTSFPVSILKVLLNICSSHRAKL
jgi:hypothetical protein